MPTNKDILGEVLNRRTENAKHFRLWDGSFQAVIYGSPVHFEDESGNWHNINTDLHDEADLDSFDGPVGKHGTDLFKAIRNKAKDEKTKNKLNRDNYDFQGLQVPFEAKLPRNFLRGYSMGKGADKLKFKPVGASPAKAYIDPDKTNCIMYQDPWNDTDVCLELTDRGIKETITLKSNRAPVNFSFEVIGELADDLTAGVLKLSPAWLQDAAGTKRDVAQTVRRENGKVYVDLTADVTGLVYPVEIDPTATIQPDGTAGKDSSVEHLNPSSNYATDTQLGVGLSNAPARYNALMQFDLSGVLGYVTSSTLNLYRNSGYANVPNFSIHSIDATWTETGVTWNTRPAHGNYTSVASGFTTANGWKSFDITALARSWVDATRVNNGLMLYTDDPTVGDSAQYFWSSDYATDATLRPKVTVAYNQAPTAPVVTAPNGGETWNALHTVAWNAASDPSTAVLGYIGPPANGYGIAAGSVDRMLQPFTAPADTNSIQTIQYNVNLQSGISVSHTVEIWTLDASYNPVSKVGTSTPVNFTATGAYQTVTADVSGKNLTLTPGGSYGLVIISNTTTPAQSMGTNTSGNGFIQNVKSAVGNGAWSTVNSSSWLSAKLTFYTPTNALQYQIQLSTDNKISWKDIVALTAAGVTSQSYDFTPEAQSSTCWIRIRAYDGAGYGPWDESNGVFTILHNTAPTAPTNLSPASGAIKDRALLQRLSWQHNDPQGDAQSKFDLQWRLQGSGTWNTVTQTTTNQYWDAPAGTFPKGNIEYQIRTYDQAGLAGPYSAQAVFYAGDKPATPTITSPANGATIAVARPTVQWSSPDQSSYQLQVLNASNQPVYDPGEVVSTNKAQTIGVDLANTSTYTIKVRIKNADGIWSDYASAGITTSFTTPAANSHTPTAQPGFIRVTITNPAPSGTQPTVTGNDLYRRKSGDASFIRIATGIAANGTYDDYAVASDVVYEYFIRANGDNGTYIDSPSVSSAVSLSGLWVHAVNNPSGTDLNIPYNVEQGETLTPDVTFPKFAGRTRAVADFGELDDFKFKVKVKLKNDQSWYTSLKSLVQLKTLLCVRDGRGRKVFGVIPALPETDTHFGQEVTFDVVELAFSEVV